MKGQLQRMRLNSRLLLLAALGAVAVSPYLYAQNADPIVAAAQVGKPGAKRPGGRIATPAIASSAPVAVLDGGRSIFLSEVDENIKSQLFELEQRIYALRKAALDKLILDAVLQQEARSQRVSVEELSRTLIPERVEIPRAKVDQEYAENASGFAGVSEDEAKMRIRVELEGQERLKRYQANVEALRAKVRVQVSLARPEQPRVTFAQTKLTRGREDAAVTVVEFSDFQCPYCRSASATVRQLVERYGDRVRIVFKHLPLSIHPNAFKAAQASVCAAEQGRFWEYHDRLFATEELALPALTETAQGLGLDLRRFSGCMQSEASAEAVREDMREASRLGLRGAPTFFVNGVQMNDDHGFATFAAVIDEQLGAQPASKGRVALNGASIEGQNHAHQQ